MSGFKYRVRQQRIDENRGLERYIEWNMYGK